jgi:hypothetical protein
MFSKKAQTISINFLVKFILAIVMFGLGVTLLWNIYAQSTDTSDLLNSDLSSRIVDLNCKPTQVVCVSTSRVEIQAGETYIVDFEIHNNHGVKINYDIEALLEDPDSGAYITLEGDIVLRIPEDRFALDGRSEKGFPIGIATTKKTPKGWYTLRVKISPVAKSGGTALSPVLRRIDIEVS